MRFSKDNQALLSGSNITAGKDGTTDPTLEPLNQMPGVKRLVSDILVFRAKMARENGSDKSAESKHPIQSNLLAES
jgi:hypothetical protein